MDIGSARRLLDVLRQVPDANADAVLDLAGVERIDASGLQILLALQAAMRRRGCSLRLLRAPEIARRALARAGLEGTLDVGETTPEAHRG
jgi:anti-anti-sigma factor